MAKLAKTAVALAMILASLGVAIEGASARGGKNAVAQASVAESEIDGCAAAQQGRPLIDCVADAVVSFSGRIDLGEVASKTQLVAVTARAGEIRGKPKAEALRVLNKLISITRGLAAKSAGDNMGPAYDAVGAVFARAISVIERRG
jgi:hypothetical protein